MGHHIVVGVDGSPHADRALAHALEEARLQDCRLVVVHAYQWPEPLAMGLGMYDVPMPGQSRLEAERGAMAVIDLALAQQSPAVEVTRTVTRGSAGTCLVEAARHAQLLVVGTRGRGQVAGLLLGSTSQYVVRHATCPVMVVPAARPSSDRETLAA